jgi:DNA-binding LytR/AlgR family response regulator
MIKCLVIEDEKMAREALMALCEKVGDIEVSTVPSALDAKKMLDNEKFDLVLLDIGLPDISGVEFLRIGLKLPPVIIISANDKYALEAFELDVVDYLKKPVTLSRFMQAVDRFKSRKQLVSAETGGVGVKEDSIFVKSDGRMIRIHLDDILVLESMRDYVIFRVKSGKHLVHTTMKNVEEQLQGDSRFIRIHRSYIINRNHIVDIQDHSVVINGQVVPVSRSHRADFLEKIRFL